MSLVAFYQIKNWREYQHYKDRNPPWVKLHTGLLDNYEFGGLDDASKLLAVVCMLLAARTDNRIPADPDWVRRKGCIKGRVDFGPLLIYGFLEEIQPLPDAEHVASTPLASCKQSAISEKRRDRGEGEGAIAPSPQNGLSKKTKKSAVPLPDDFSLTEPLRQKALERFPDCDPDQMFEQFVAHHRSHGKVMADWSQAWVTWLGNGERFGYPKRSGLRWQ